MKTMKTMKFAVAVGVVVLAVLGAFGLAHASTYGAPQCSGGVCVYRDVSLPPVPNDTLQSWGRVPSLLGFMGPMPFRINVGVCPDLRLGCMVARTSHGGSVGAYTVTIYDGQDDGPTLNGDELLDRGLGGQGYAYNTTNIVIAARYRQIYWLQQEGQGFGSCWWVQGDWRYNNQVVANDCFHPDVKALAEQIIAENHLQGQAFTSAVYDQLCAATVARVRSFAPYLDGFVCPAYDSRLAGLFTSREGPIGKGWQRVAIEILIAILKYWQDHPIRPLGVQSSGPWDLFSTTVQMVRSSISAGP